MYAITGASGQYGRLAIEALLGKVPADQIVALARDPSKIADIAERGVTVRRFDYSQPEELAPALEGVTSLLLVSSSEVGQREAQHGAVIEAAKAAGVGFIAYTSILHADENPLQLVEEHRATEMLLKASGISCALLRNGWYSENYISDALAGIATGSIYGSSGDGRFSMAARADYAAAAVEILLSKDRTGTFELAGDESFTMAEIAALVSSISGRPVTYVDLPKDDYCAALEAVGIPAPLAAVFADSSSKSSGSALHDDSRVLSRLLGRPATPLRETIERALT